MKKSKYPRVKTRLAAGRRLNQIAPGLPLDAVEISMNILLERGILLIRRLPKNKIYVAGFIDDGKPPKTGK